jgi:hypothetical protein
MSASYEVYGSLMIEVKIKKTINASVSLSEEEIFSRVKYTLFDRPEDYEILKQSLKIIRKF